MAVFGFFYFSLNVVTVLLQVLESPVAMSLITSSYSTGLSCQSKPFLKTPLVLQQLAVCTGKIPEPLKHMIL